MYDMLVQEDEMKTAYQQGVLSMSNLIVESELHERYSSPLSSCNGSDEFLKYALFLYLFALDTWCPDCDDNFLEKTELQSVLYNVENLSTRCCEICN